MPIGYMWFMNDINQIWFISIIVPEALNSYVVSNQLGEKKKKKKKHWFLDRIIKYNFLETGDINSNLIIYIYIITKLSQRCLEGD